MKILIERNGVRSEMDADLMEKRTGVQETDDQRLEWVEYWLDGENVHRSVHLHIKRGLPLDSAIGQVG